MIVEFISALERAPETQSDCFLRSLQMIWDRNRDYPPERLIRSLEGRVRLVHTTSRWRIYECLDGSQFRVRFDGQVAEGWYPLSVCESGRGSPR